MDAPYQATDDVHVLRSHAPLPGVGVLPINAFVLLAEDPVLVDTGAALDSDQLIDALSSIIDPVKLKWVWLTHDDADHTGSIQRIMELAPNARLVTHAFSALRMASWWPVPLDRVYAIRPGDEISVGDRTLRAVAPPLYDNPMSTGFVDQKTGAFFCVDSFGAILPEPVEHVKDVAPEALAGGMMGWATSDSPWAHIVDRNKWGEVLDRVRRLQPTHFFSSHLPSASGTSLEDFLRTLEMVPDAEEELPPNHEEFAHLIEALNQMQRQPAIAL